MSATAAQDGDLKITEGRGLKWYRSSDTARRGFCGECGSTLFWKGDGKDYTAIAAGSLDGATGLNLRATSIATMPATTMKSRAAATG